MRCFVAIEIEKGIRTRLNQLQKQLQKRCSLLPGTVKWVEPENIHLTLKFIGDVRDRDITSVCKIVEDVVGQYEGFTIDVRKLGYFGSPPRVVWVGVEPDPNMLDMQKSLDEQLSIAGLADEDNKGFKGHLTLCRVKDFKAGRTLKAAVDEFDEVELGFQTVDQVHVYSSELTKHGPIYAVVSSSDLK